MADQLYLSYWIRGFTEHNMLRHFERVLSRFPFSKLHPRALMAVRAVELSEPPLLEREFPDGIEASAVVEAAKWFQNRDCAFELAAFWDLWQMNPEGEFKLMPSAVGIICYAPLFESEYGEQIRFEFGMDSQFLPQPEIPSSLTPVRQNIKSLLHLVKDLDEALTVEKRQLWSESGGNFAERLQEALGGP
jgi:hypothetical protein